MTYVLLTRPEEDCQELRAKLIVPTISSPLLKVKQTIKKVTLPEGITDLIVTSARVFEMVTNIKSMIAIPVWCVGEATAAAAKVAGFETIYQVNRSAQEILERIVKECPKDTSHFVHICGSVVHVDLADALAKLGFKADKIIIYETEAADNLTSEAEKIMEGGFIQQMPFFSLRTAEVFIDIARKKKWAEKLSKVRALAHSEAIARTLRQISWQEVILVPDLSAERIMEYYKRPGDHSMKQGSWISQFLITTGVAALVSIAIFYFWPNLTQPKIIENAVIEDLQQLEKDVVSIKEQLKATHELQDQITNLGNTIIQLEKEITHQKSQQELVQPEAQSQPTSVIPAEPVPDLSQVVKTLYQELMTGSVLRETLDIANKALPQDQQLPLQLISIRDLLDQLQFLPELKREVDVTVGDSFVQKGMDWAGVKVRKSETTSLKEQVAAGLKAQDFSFLNELDKMNLSPDWAAWVKNCHQTQIVFEFAKASLSQGVVQPAGDSQ